MFTQLHQLLFDLIFSLAGRGAWLDWFLVFAARDLGWWLLALLVVYLAAKRPLAWQAGLLVGTPLVAWLVAEVAKLIIRAGRPFLALEGVAPLLAPAGFAFPSGHAAAFAALATIVYLFNRGWGRWYFLAAGLIGVARVAVGAHWPIDVLGGWLLGLALALAAFFLINWRCRSLR